MTQAKGTSPLVFGTVLVLIMALAACSREDPWQTRDISGLMPPLAFTLMDEHGNTVTAEDYRGKASLLFFGFVSCPDVCPNTLAEISRLLEQLPEESQNNIQVLFVSVDPERDSPEDLQSYTDYFGPRFVGLTGTQEALRTLNKRYRVTYGYGEPDEEGHYPVSHSGAVFGFTPEGEARILISDISDTEAVMSDLRHLAASQ